MRARKHLPFPPAAAADSRPLLWTPAFVRLLASGAAYGFAFSSFHLMPKFLATEFGATPSAIGWQAGVFGLSSVAATLAVGARIDQMCRRRLFAASALMLAATAVGFTMVEAMGPLVLLLRAVQGVAFTMQMASFSTLVAEIAPPSRMGEAVGLAGSSMLVMNAVAPAVDEPLARAAGWPAAFALAAVAGLVSMALVLDAPSRLRNPGGSGARGKRGAESGGLRIVLGRAATRDYCMVTLLVAVAFATMFTFLQPLALAAGHRDVGTFFVAYASAACAVRVVAGSLPDRCGRRRVAGAALVPYALVIAWVAALGPTSLPLIGAVFGLAHGLLFPALNALAIESTRPDERGRLLTIFAGTFNFGAWGGAAALGPVAEAMGFAPVFWLGALSAAAALAWLLASSALAPPHAVHARA